MYRWHIVIEAWPHSTGKGQDVDQAAAGERVQSYYVEANDVRAALRSATCIQNGMVSNPAVWEAPIIGITRVKN